MGILSLIFGSSTSLVENTADSVGRAWKALLDQGIEESSEIAKYICQMRAMGGSYDISSEIDNYNRLGFEISPKLIVELILMAEANMKLEQLNKTKFKHAIEKGLQKYNL